MKTELLILLIILLYFGLLLCISALTGRKSDGNNAFFLGNRKSPWYIVAFGMIGTSISGVTFVSVPGMVEKIGFTYLQMCMGFVVGYVLIAYVLLPIYFKLHLTTIYEYLKKRLGESSYRTGASYFLLSKITGAAARLYIVVMLLHTFVFAKFGIPFYASVGTIIFLIWLYTFKSGIKTIIWTDFLQTLVLLTALILILTNTCRELGFSLPDAVRAVGNESELSRIFVFDDWHTTQNFFKQFVSGIFITIVMTGLDQDMMQKNLSCRNLHESRKNMLSYGVCFLPVNLLFLGLGALLVLLGRAKGLELPSAGDQLLPFFAADRLGSATTVLFFLGIIAASFSSADSALTSLTTSVSVDLVNIKKRAQRKQKHIRMMIHITVCVCFFILILAIDHFGRDTSIIDTIYRLASYTYGPLLGMFTYGLFSRRKIKDRFMPYVALSAPILIAVTDWGCREFLHYQFGYEILLLNAVLTIGGMVLITNWKGTPERKKAFLSH
ncbi:MAG: sodium:solute symporter [Paludibacteraceae bacterium]|nr:sodium:solute symporter [Paludibacteraceae bacterium]